MSLVDSNSVATLSVDLDVESTVESAVASHEDDAKAVSAMVLSAVDSVALDVESAEVSVEAVAESGLESAEDDVSSVEVAVTPVSVSQSESEAVSVKLLVDSVVESSSVVEPVKELRVVQCGYRSVFVLQHRPFYSGLGWPCGVQTLVPWVSSVDPWWQPLLLPIG